MKASDDGEIVLKGTSQSLAFWKRRGLLVVLDTHNWTLLLFDLADGKSSPQDTLELGPDLAIPSEPCSVQFGDVSGTLFIGCAAGGDVGVYSVDLEARKVVGRHARHLDRDFDCLAVDETASNTTVLYGTSVNQGLLTKVEEADDDDESKTKVDQVAVRMASNLALWDDKVFVVGEEQQQQQQQPDGGAKEPGVFVVDKRSLTVLRVLRFGGWSSLGGLCLLVPTAGSTPSSEAVLLTTALDGRSRRSIHTFGPEGQPVDRVRLACFDHDPEALVLDLTSVTVATEDRRKGSSSLVLLKQDPEPVFSLQKIRLTTDRDDDDDGV